MKDLQTKKRIIELLEKSPIVEFACNKAGISRMTYYRWLKEDKAFRKQAEAALASSRDLMNDVAESQLIQAVKNGNMAAVKFWLANNHKLYKKFRQAAEEELAIELTPEEKKLVKELARLINKTPLP